jgi:hypothetical protein
MDPKFDAFSSWAVAAGRHISQLVHEKKMEPKSVNRVIGGKATVFRHLLNDDSLEESEWSVDRLTKEARILMGAGSVSPVRTLHFISFFLLANPLMRKRVEEELAEVMAGWPEVILNVGTAGEAFVSASCHQRRATAQLRHSYGTATAQLRHYAPIAPNLTL